MKCFTHKASAGLALTLATLWAGMAFTGCTSNSEEIDTSIGVWNESWPDNYIISYFKSDSNGNANLESLFLGYSEDGLNYQALNNNTYVYKIDASTGSGGQAIRDPYMNRIHDDDPNDSVSRFIMLATDWTWYGSTSYGKAEYGTTGQTGNAYWSGYSPCLIMSEVHVDTSANTVKFYKPGSSTEGSTCVRMINLAMHAWAPEIIIDYNADGSAKPVYSKDGTDYLYGVVWSGNGTLTSAGGNNRTFVNYTNDFVTFTDPIVFFEDGNEIDVTIQKANGKFYLFYKGESGDLKGIKTAVSDSLDPGSFTVLNGGVQITEAGFEGPWAVYKNGTWWMFADNYAAGGRSTGTANFYGFSSSSISASKGNWVTHANDGKYSFPTGIRHAFAFKVTAEELATFKAVYN